MTDFQSNSGPSASVQLPQGWKTGWSDQYREHFFVNPHTGQSQWEQPQHPVSTFEPSASQNAGYNGQGGNTNTLINFSDKIPVDNKQKLSASEFLASSIGPGHETYKADDNYDTKQESEFLADYEFDDAVSAQAQSESSLGWSRKRSCRVLVKRFHKADENDLARADREVTALGSLSDPAIPPLLEVFDSPTTRFVVLETRSDSALKQYIESNGPIPEDMLKALMTQMFGGMAAIFMAGFTHLRICDETLHIEKSGQITFKDFHYAHDYSKEVDGRQYALVQDKYGSDLYVAPEVFAVNSYNGRKASLWSCGIAIYYMATGQTAKLASIEHPNNDNMRPVNDSPSSSRRQSTVGPQSPRRMSLSGRKLSLSNPPTVIPYPGTTRFDVPSYVRDIVSKLLITNPLRRAELIEVAAKVPKEFVFKSTRPLMELAWLDYKTHVGPLAGLIDTGELDSSASSVFSGVSKMSNPFASLLGGRRRSSIKNDTYGKYV